MKTIKTTMSCLSARTIDSIIAKLLELIPKPDFSERKLGGPGKNVQIDETMLNYKCKSHRGRSPTNKTDALCIIETDCVDKNAYACIL